MPPPDADAAASELTARTSHAGAARALAARDPVMASLVLWAGLPRLGARPRDHFAALVRSITYQQLAGRAAAAIHARLVEACGGTVTPERVVSLGTAPLRAAGLSGAKTATIGDLAVKVLEGAVDLAPRVLARETEEAIIERLSQVRGIGRWTAQMFLIFQLRRLDVWPSGDLGVRRGYGLAYGVDPMPPPAQLELLGDAFRPFRSVAAWYCWRACERSTGSGPSAVTI